MGENDDRQLRKENRTLQKKVERLERARRIHEDMWDRNSNLFKKLNEEVEHQAQEIQKKNDALERELALTQEYRAEALRRIEGPLVGSSPAVQALRAGVEQRASETDPLLLVAAPGSGPEAISRAIHDASPRRGGPFVMVDCAILVSASHAALLPDSSGDVTPNVSKYELARGGTLYFEGVDQLPADVQSVLLRAIQSTSGEAEVRVIGSAKSPTFPQGYSSELARHLTKSQLRAPTLAERREDIPALVDHFLKRSARQLGKVFDGVSAESIKRMQDYSWPGDLRELGDVVRRSVIGATGKLLEVDPALLEEGVPFGGYRLIRRLGAGGMGEVWVARHQLLAREVAVKLVKPEMLGDPGNRKTIVDRFRREAEATAQLRSVHTVELYEFGVNDEGALFYVMELLHGLDLGQLVQRHGLVPAPRAVSLLMQACSSLAEAHDLGLVHRDIKPANMFVCRLGLQADVLKVLDFGLVANQRGPDDDRLTQAGATFGTPATMSPEACVDSAEVDGRADIYSLGCVGYWLLAGRMPFQSDSVTRLLIKHVQEQPPTFEALGVDVPENLGVLVLQCLAKKPEDRPTARQLLEALRITSLADEWSAADADAWWERANTKPSGNDGCDISDKPTEFS